MDAKAELAWKQQDENTPAAARYGFIHDEKRELSLRTRRALLLVLLVLGWLFSKIAFWRSAVVPSPSLRAELSRDSQQYVESDDIFDWNSHPPSKQLNWTECYDTFRCARLTVPLDYSEPEGEEAAVAVIQYPSRFPPGHDEYRGPILFNPGGPGGSGVDMVKGRAGSFRAILGEGFDLVGFDPRGVGQTTPRLEVFTTALEAGTLLAQHEGSVNASPAALGRTFALAQNLGNLALQRAEKVAKHVSTPVVARDMLSIVNASGQEKLQYWGFSYGTVLGATFAAMFPDKVGRVIIDGVVDSENYYDGLWSNNLRDTDAVLEDIYQSCVSAGQQCAVHNSSTSEIRGRIDALLTKLRTAPLPVQAEDGGSAIVDYSTARQVIFSTLYQTHNRGAPLVQALAELEGGNGTTIYAWSSTREVNGLLSCSCGEPVSFNAPYEKLAAIACGDVEDRGETLDDLRDAYEEMAVMSSFAEVWPERALCAGWKIRGKERFNGSFDQVTNHPLLLIGNVADPVTPLWNAHKMSKGFKKSVVLTQNSSGHCSLAATSLCTARAVRSYLINGTLPEEGTVCQVESSIFGTTLDLDSLASNDEDRQLLRASRELQENYFVPEFF